MTALIETHQHFFLACTRVQIMSKNLYAPKEKKYDFGVTFLDLRRNKASYFSDVG